MGALPIVAIVLAVAGALGVALVLQSSESTANVEAARGSGPAPFAKYREEAPTARGEREEIQWREAPPGLANEDVWVTALAIAKDADEVLDEANKARAAGDNAMYQAKGRRAKEAYDRALVSTAEWEELIRSQYGDRNPQVREVMRVRTRWFDKLRVLHKTTGR